jgi:formate--tetrahydrofolate ligase
MAAILKDAIKPNFVQTLENNLAIIHGGPFANIAHGCNSVTATKTALKLADYVVTEAGFGADLGAEKFINIKCRSANITPSAVVLVATIRALKFHGGVEKDHLNQENLDALDIGFANLQRHVHNITKNYGLKVIVSINHFTFDTDKEIELLQNKCKTIGVKCIVSTHWANGGKGAIKLAQEILNITNKENKKCSFLYDDNLSIWKKIETISKKIYGASKLTASTKIRNEINRLEKNYGTLPVCIAKTQMSFSTNPELKGAPKNHTIEISGIKLENGAGFIVAIAGNMMTMPGLPKNPVAQNIDIDENGVISGLF